MEIKCHVIVVGKVQGVYYRASAQQQATSLELKGFVRNVYDGSVELVAQGEEAAVLCFLDWCRKGPPAAKVVDVRVTWDSKDRPLPYALHGDLFEIVASREATGMSL